jgi:hypothetical protein
MHCLSQKMDWATFWATFSQTHLVTLGPHDRLVCKVRRDGLLRKVRELLCDANECKSKKFFNLSQFCRKKHIRRKKAAEKMGCDRPTYLHIDDSVKSRFLKQYNHDEAPNETLFLIFLWPMPSLLLLTHKQCILRHFCLAKLNQRMHLSTPPPQFGNKC